MTERKLIAYFMVVGFVVFLVVVLFIRWASAA